MAVMVQASWLLVVIGNAVSQNVSLIARSSVPFCHGTIGHLRLNRDLNKCLDIVGEKAVNGAKLQLWDCNGLANQNFIWCTDGRIVSDMNNWMCVDIPNGDVKSSHYLQMWECNGGQGQYWGYDGNTWSIYPHVTGENMCMDVVGASTDRGTLVNSFPCKPGGGEKWILGKPPQGCINDIFQFRLDNDKSKCMDIIGGHAANGAQVQIWNCNGKANQNFMWCADGRIVSAIDDDMCLDIPFDEANKPHNLQLWECNRHASQYWQYDANTLSVYPHQVGETMCMDVVGGSTAPGASVNIYYCKAGSGQRWYTGSVADEITV